MKKQNLEEVSLFGIRGDVEIKEYELAVDENGNTYRTGKLVGEYTEKNVILNQGTRLILESFAEQSKVDSAAKTIKIGNDTGAGTILNPAPATTNMTEANQNVLYETPVEEFFVSYPTQDSVKFLATINGPAVMSMYPSLPNVIYTSASLYTHSGKSVTYKRFSARTISSLISVDITWTISLTRV